MRVRVRVRVRVCVRVRARARGLMAALPGGGPAEDGSEPRSQVRADADYVVALSVSRRTRGSTLSCRK